MGPIRIGLAQVNPTVGDLSGNRELILKFARHAKSGGAHILLFPEMVLTGYPVEDLAMRPSFRDGSRRAINELALALAESEFEDLVSVVGYLDESESGSPQNAIAIIYRGEIKARYIKHHLPNYGVFDEFRNFTPGNTSLIVRIHGIDVGFAICEDIWQDGGPVAELANRGAGLLLVPNGSPFEKAKDDKRLELASRRAREVGAPLVYVNMVGGQDDLVFDGDSIVVDAGGKLIARSPQFVEGLALVDLEARLRSADPDLVITDIPIAKYEKLKIGKIDALDTYGEIWEALVLGLKDYVTKNGFKSVALGLSGGIDSALVAVIAVDALGPQAVHAIALPSRYSSTHSLEDALALALNTGLNYRVISIEPMVTAYLNSINLDGLAEENLQARVRGTTLMGLSNQEGHLILATGNKSELAVGYSTLYGDAVGGFAPIKDIFKVDVWNLAKWRNDQAIKRGETPPIPTNSISKEPSAELRPGQKDSDSLPEYPILDQILAIYIEKAGSVDAIVAAGFDRALAEKVILMVDRAEFKRRQYPPGPKVTSLAFGKDRRLPMTSHWRESR
ncbi:MAG: NAD+ synthase [Streptomycetaceae bacterium]|nr:MAG: NAD+ synthase [Streptomycetaceae bacterium]